MRDERKTLVINQGNPSQINLIFKFLEPKRTRKEIEIEFKGKKKTYELNQNFQKGYD